MRRSLVVLTSLVLASSAFAEDKPKVNTLTPKEVADGWILLFDGETTYGWTAQSDQPNEKADFSVKDGALVLAGKKTLLRPNSRFRYFELTGEYKSKAKDNLVHLGFGRPGEQGSEIAVAQALSPSEQDEWRTISARWVPGKVVLQATEAGGVNVKEEMVASFGLRLPRNEEGRIELRNLKLRPLEAKPLFNGKNLDGWSINKADPKRMISKWEVTQDGELSLKNGPGDLVSEKEFDNFVLQVECKTLGEALNSGVFFRNIPGEYQNGYEAQIQNAFMSNDRTKPVDFGTGAIYRRIKARKVVSNDNEWFTMTVLAEGKHIATWVNGYQTVDWIDDRPTNANPRNGYRATKGPISLQGHDKTTDLLFRNIRISELPVEKK
jgi:hypothetical protein